MSGLLLILGVILGGAAGTVTRVLIAQRLMPTLPGQFPAGTLVVNLSGSFLIGLLVGAAMFILAADLPWPVVVLVYGFLGAFTTVSSLSLECLMMVRAGHLRLAMVYLSASVIGGLLLVTAGLGLMLAWSRAGFPW